MMRAPLPARGRTFYSRRSCSFLWLGSGPAQDRTRKNPPLHQASPRGRLMRGGYVIDYKLFKLNRLRQNAQPKMSKVMSIRRLVATLLVAFGLVSSVSVASAQDWAKLETFAAANAALAAPVEGQPRVVLMGDSITEEWLRLRPDFFDGNGYVGRGISGQVSAQMLVRFRQDVIDLHPAAVVINAGTNDVAENQGPYSEDFAFGNIVSMTELAQANGIAVILTSVLPAAGFRWRPSVTDAADKIAALNVRIAAYAAEKGIPYVDYYTPMVVADSTRALNPDYSNDGVHPVPDGYAVMEPLVVEAINAALAAAQPASCPSHSACGCCR